MWIFISSKFVLTAAHCFDDGDYPKNDKNKWAVTKVIILDKNVLGWVKFKSVVQQLLAGSCTCTYALKQLGNFSNQKIIKIVENKIKFATRLLTKRDRKKNVLELRMCFVHHQILLSTKIVQILRFQNECYFTIFKDIQRFIHLLYL